MSNINELNPNTCPGCGGFADNGYDRSDPPSPYYCTHCEAEYSEGVDDVQVGGTHYKDMAIEPWTVIEAVLTPEEFQGFLKGNVIKYAMRQGKKEGSDDGGKAKHYADKLEQVKKKYGVK